VFWYRLLAVCRRSGRGISLSIVSNLSYIHESSGHTLDALIPDLLQIHLSTKPPPHRTQTPTPGNRISHRIILLQVVFRKPRIHAFVRETRIHDLGLQASGANAVCDAFLYCASFALYAENFGAARYADGGVVAGYALREVYEYAEGGCEAVSGVGNR
jgi:hypothetical protein